MDLVGGIQFGHGLGKTKLGANHVHARLLFDRLKLIQTDPFAWGSPLAPYVAGIPNPNLVTDGSVKLEAFRNDMTAATHVRLS
jgi:hypothetical protein